MSLACMWPNIQVKLGFAVMIFLVISMHATIVTSVHDSCVTQHSGQVRICCHDFVSDQQM